MNFDRKSLDKLLSLDDESFKALARTIAEAAGASKAQTEMMLANPEILKSRLSRITPDEANRLLDAAGKEKSAQIMDMLKNKGVDLG